MRRNFILNIVVYLILCILIVLISSCKPGTCKETCPVSSIRFDVENSNISFHDTIKKWNIGGTTSLNFVSLPPGWKLGGDDRTNFIAVPNGWEIGEESGTNFVTFPGKHMNTIKINFNNPGNFGLLSVRIMKKVMVLIEILK